MTDQPHSPSASEPLVALRSLSRHFVRGGGLGGGRHVVCAVDDVSLDVFSGETLGIVGESGCGKSTLGRMAVGLLEPSAGDVFIRGRSLWNKQAHADYSAFRKSLAGVIQMVFQDPQSSLNPRMRVGDSIAEPLICSSSWRAGLEKDSGRAAIGQRVSLMLRNVGLDPDAARRYPHEFSGGQRQRIAIARALASGPAFVVCDEPTSSLDASVQAQVLNLLRDMQDELKLTYMFISHDLAVVRHMSKRVAVMYLGSVVESGNADDLFKQALHPYTQLLLELAPGLPELGEALAGTQTASGCPFAPRCPQVMPLCGQSRPQLAPPVGVLDAEQRLVRCFLYA